MSELCQNRKSHSSGRLYGYPLGGLGLVKAFSGPERTSITKGGKSVRKPPIGRKVPAARKRAPRTMI